MHYIKEHNIIGELGDSHMVSGDNGCQDFSIQSCIAPAQFRISAMVQVCTL